MKNLTKYTIVAAALTFAFTAKAVQPAVADPDAGRVKLALTTRANDQQLTWAVVRVSVSDRGDVEGMRIAYQSGDKPFNKMALQAVAKTTFTPILETPKASTFDYLLTTNADGKRATRIMARLPGDAHVSPAAGVAVRGTNPWISDGLSGARR